MPVEEEELFRVLTRFYGALGLPFRPESVGSANRAGNEAPVGSFVEAFAAEAGPATEPNAFRSTTRRSRWHAPRLTPRGTDRRTGIANRTRSLIPSHA